MKALNPMTEMSLEEEEDTETHREGHVKARAETGLRQLAASHGLPGATRSREEAKEVSFLTPPKEARTC